MPEPIHSVQNLRIKRALRLRDACQRRATGLMLIDGMKEIHQAILGGIEIQELFIDEQLSSIVETLGPATSSLSDQTKLHLNKVTTRVSSSVVDKLAFGNRNESLVAIAKQPSVELGRLPEAEQSLILVIDQVEKPGNVGAMVRTADAVGATAVILSDPVCEVWNSNAIRSSLGAIFRIPIAVGTSRSVIEWLANRSYQTVAARVDGAVNYRPFAWNSKIAVVVGSEANGLSDIWHRPEVIGMSLPMRGTVDSLNVSVSAAILLYEAASSFIPSGKGLAGGMEL